MNNYYIIFFLEGMVLTLGSVLMLFICRFPAFFKLIFAKRCVWELDGDGQLLPVKARTHSGAMITKDAVYPYTKNDVVRCSGLTGILAHKASDSRAINPRLMPVFSLFKKIHVDSMEDIEAILKAPLISAEKYNSMMDQQAKQELQGAE